VKPQTLRRQLLAEATIALALARLAVRFVSAERIVAWAARPPRRYDRFAAARYVEATARAVDEIGSKPWMDAPCLPRAIAVQAMLRRRGIASRLCLGATREAGALAAHAWIELGDEIVIGGAEQPRYTNIVSLG
jgi:hypothetical protein